MGLLVAIILSLSVRVGIITDPNGLVGNTTTSKVITDPNGLTVSTNSSSIITDPNGRP